MSRLGDLPSIIAAACSLGSVRHPDRDRCCKDTAVASDWIGSRARVELLIKFRHGGGGNAVLQWNSTRIVLGI